MKTARLSMTNRNVILTGATGYVGIYVLAELLRRRDVTPVCVVRAPSDEAALQKLRARFSWYFPDDEEPLSRAVVLAGDIASTRLGLSEARYADLAESTESIIHSAADVRAFAPAEDVFRANVEGTRRMIELAMAGTRKRLHHVSTMSVAGVNQRTDRQRFTERHFDYGQRFRGAYDESKFEAERLVRERLPDARSASVYRVDNVTADSVTGRFQINIQDNLTYQLLKSIAVARMAPAMPGVTINFSYVDVVARAIVANAIAADPSYCLHLANPDNQPIESVVRGMREFGYPIVVVDAEEFVRRARDRSYRDDAVFLGGLWVSFTLANQKTNALALDHTHSVGRLADIGVRFPSFDLGWFARLLAHAVAVGYFPPPETARLAVLPAR